MKRIVLDKRFQKEIFKTLLSKFSRHKLTITLGINSSSIYNMKNGKIRSIDIKKFGKIVKLLHLSDEIVKKNTLEIISEKDILKGLEIGREIRKNQLKKWKDEIPRLKEIVNNNSLNLELWLEKYIKLTNFGARKIIKTEKDADKIIICLKTHSNVTKTKKIYRILLPRHINLDDEFAYFFGLWCGDRVGGGRLGIVNTQNELILLSRKYLRKLYQKNLLYVILKSTKMKEPLPRLHFKVNKIYKVKNMPGTYVPMIFSTNGYLKSFFDYLDENLDELLSMLENKHIFFSGLFDAEGNVSLEDSYFRWSCKNMRNVEIYKKHLSDFNLFGRYDGASLVTNNADSFLKNIFPHVKQKEKINRVNLLFFDSGHLDDRFKNILICISDSPGKTAKELAKIIGRKKVYSQIKFLCRKEYSKTEGYPMRFFITEKGIEELRREGQC